MLNRITHTGIFVHDIDEALDFYTAKLGFEVRYDIRDAKWSWVVVAPPGSDGPELILSVPGPPLVDKETGRYLLELAATGAFSAGIIQTDDCRGDFRALSARGVQFYQEPIERAFGVDAAFRDPTGNSWRMTERSAGFD